MAKQMKVEISTPKGLNGEWLYASLDLPAEEHEIRDALHRARVMSNDDERYLSVYDCDAIPMLSFARVETEGIEELNFLAQRLDSLEDYERNVLLTVTPRIIKNVGEGDVVSAKDLINLTYGLDKVTVAHNVGNTSELGELAIESEMFTWMEGVPDEALPYLDRRKIGQELYESDQGAFKNGMYIAAGEYQFQEVYDGRNLPNQGVSTAYAFRLELAKPPSDGEDISEQPSEWLGLPVDREDADAVARRLGVDKIEDCVYLGFESSVPQIEGDHFDNMHDFNMLNSLADMMLQMSPSDQVKFKAVLSAEEPEKIEEILDIARNLRRYDLATQVDDPAQFFKSYLIRHMDKEVDPKWLDTLLLRNEGHELAERLGATFTDYGVVSARNRSLYEPIPRNNPIMDEKFDLIEVNGQQALFSNGMIKPENIPKGLYKYDLRGGEIGDFLTIEPIVRVNRSGTILVKEPFEFDGKDHIPLTGETSPNFLCEEVTPREFLNGDYEQAEAEEMDIKMGGM